MRLRTFTMALAFLALAGPSLAEDGTVVITQESAIAGNVTPGDEPGFPVKISRAGNYKLGSNLVVRGNQHGIVVIRHNVTIDLNGFLLDGQEKGRTGIYTRAVNVAVKNGSILSFKEWGIHGWHVATVDNLRVLFNDGGGIKVGGYGRVTNSTVLANGGIGVEIGMWSAIQDNLVADNGHQTSSPRQIDAPYSHVYGNAIMPDDGLAIRGGFTGAGDNTVLGGDPTSVLFNGVMPMHPNACMTDKACPYNPEGGPVANAAPVRLTPPQRYRGAQIDLARTWLAEKSRSRR